MVQASGYSIYGLLMAHFAIRGLMHEAALHADEDPDRLSYLPAVRVVRRKRARAVALPPRGTRKRCMRRCCGNYWGSVRTRAAGCNDRAASIAR